MRPAGLRLLALGALTLLPALASAQSVGVYRTASGARAAALAGADQALGRTPLEALTFNPAGLASVQTRDASLTLAAVSASGAFANRVDPAGGLQDARGVIPEGALAWRLGTSDVVVGAGVTVDGAIGGDWQFQDAPGVAGATYGSQVHRSSIRVARMGLGLGWQASRLVAVGVQVSALRNDNELVAPYIFQSQAPLVGLKTLLDVETGGWGASGTFGVVLTPSDAVTIGASYRTGSALTTRGTATGDVGAQLSSLGLDVPGGFTYAAQVANRFPQQAGVSTRLRLTPHLHAVAQADWWDWSRAFERLDITLDRGTNAVVNSVVGGSTIRERVPLAWRDQVVRRAGLEWNAHQRVVVRGGYAYGGRVVPDGTLTPMTAAIIEHTLGVGVGLTLSSGVVDVAWQVSPGTERRVGTSALAGAGEYDGTSTEVSMRTFVLSWSRRF